MRRAAVLCAYSSPNWNEWQGRASLLLARGVESKAMGGGRGGLHRASWGSWGSKLVAQLGNNPPLINQSLTAQVIVYRLTVPSPSVVHRFRPGRLQGARTERDWLFPSPRPPHAVSGLWETASFARTMG